MQKGDAQISGFTVLKKATSHWKIKKNSSSWFVQWSWDIYILEKLFLKTKLLIKYERQKYKKNPAHHVIENYVAVHLEKFLQDRIKHERVGALRVSTDNFV